MEYIIISLLTISFFTYIVYVTANKILAIQMHIKYLILCACCALLISLILPRIFVGSAGLTGTFGIVIIFAIISSYCIAYYYDDTMQKALLRSSLATNSVEVLETLQTAKGEAIQLIPNLEGTWPQPGLQASAEECFTANDPIEQSDLIIAEPTCACFLESENMILSDDLNKIIQINNVVEITDYSKPITESVGKKYFYPIKYEEWDRNYVALKRDHIIKQNNSEVLLNNTAQIHKGVNIFKNKMKFKQKIAIKNTPFILENTHEHLDNDVSQQLTISQGDSLPENTVPKLIAEDSYPSSNDLDILMDFAFLQKEQRNFVQALKFFRQALTLYPDSEACPFLVMEIGTILKNLGSYNEAIIVFTEGRLLPGIINNSMLEQEFINNIAYLRIVKNILIQHSLEFMPFNSIPKNAFNEINTEFCEWRNQS